MSSEIINIGYGQSGVRISDAIWSQLICEHGINRDATKTKSYKVDEKFKGNVTDNTKTFFDEVSEEKYVPRQQFIDTETDAVNSVQAGKNHRLYNTDHFVYPTSHDNTRRNGADYDVGGSAARGFNNTKNLIEDSMDKLRKMSEKCENLQGFTQIYSTSGGAGGKAAKLSQKLEEFFPKKTNICFYSMPNFVPNTSPVIEPINCQLIIEEMSKVSHLEFYWQNRALYNVLESNLDMYEPRLTDINKLIAMAYSDLTASMRFGGNGNKSLNEIVTNLVCFKEIKQAQLSITPLLDPEDCHVQTHNMHDLLEEAYSDNNSFCTNPNSNIQRLTELSSMFTFRGSQADNCLVSDIGRFTKTYTKSLLNERKVAFCPRTRKMDQNTSFVGETNCSLLLARVTNNFTDIYSTVLENVQKMHKKGAFKHSKVYGDYWGEKGYDVKQRVKCMDEIFKSVKYGQNDDDVDENSQF